MDETDYGKRYEDGAKLLDKAAGYAKDLWFEIVAENGRITDQGSATVSTRAQEEQERLEGQLSEALSDCSKWREQNLLLLEAALRHKLTCDAKKPSPGIGKDPPPDIKDFWLPEPKREGSAISRFDLDHWRAHSDWLQGLAFALRLVADRLCSLQVGSKAAAGK
jgi:hypothetical protein